jgi:hypothetical protein
METNEPDRCIRLEIPGEGYFDITKDTAELWLHQLMIQLHINDLREFADDENPTPLVGMD